MRGRFRVIGGHRSKVDRDLDGLLLQHPCMNRVSELHAELSSTAIVMRGRGEKLHSALSSVSRECIGRPVNEVAEQHQRALETTALKSISSRESFSAVPQSPHIHTVTYFEKRNKWKEGGRPAGIHPTCYESSRASIVGWKLRTREKQPRWSSGERKSRAGRLLQQQRRRSPPRRSTVHAAFFSSSVNYEQPLPRRSPKKKPKPAAGKPLEHTHKRLPRRPARRERRKEKHSKSPENDVTVHIWA
ncbi:hypothetical protein HPB51_002823 [Rhipicephalus microplus]|uniref:Uncharacterized protein n=1 Tax=Rhipicephalus microplus TaxID=6941 RepID=A0A9J6EWV5_RHIMP|nr:hypothetical protein HPB51_002823 [Rhipicephalus microplus]